jgi:quercetin dioxygenase-like cupin family protein
MGTARITPQKFLAPVDKAVVEADWDRRGFGCFWHMAPGGRKWMDCIHKSNALVVVVDGQVAFTVDGERNTLGPGDEILIPRGSVHHIENMSNESSRWLYGFDVAPEDEEAA